MHIGTRLEHEGYVLVGTPSGSPEMRPRKVPEHRCVSLPGALEADSLWQTYSDEEIVYDKVVELNEFYILHL